MFNIILLCFVIPVSTDIRMGTFTRNYSLPSILYIFKSEVSHGMVICDIDDTICSEICEITSEVNIPVTVHISNNLQTRVLSKLIVMYFRSNILSFFERNSPWPSDTYYIMFISSNQSTKILPTLWRSYKIRRAVLFHDTSSYMGSVFDVLTNTTKMVDVRNISIREFFKVKNFQGYHLRVTLFERIPEVMKMEDHYVGANYRMMEALAQKLNFTPIIQDSSDGRKFGEYVNGVYTGGLGDIVYDRSDVAFNGYFLWKARNNEYKYLYPVTMDYICLVAPKAGKVPKRLVPFMCFQFNVWFTMIFCFVSVYVCRYIVSYIRRNYLDQEEDSNLLSLFAVAINVPISFKQYRYLSSRIILVIFLTQMYVLVTSFQGSLVTLLSIPKYYTDIDTLTELNNSVLDIKTSSQTITQIFRQDSTLRTMMKKIKRLNGDDFLNFNFTFFARIVYHKTNEFRNFYIKKENRTLMVHRLTECPMWYFTSFVVKWNFSFVDEFNSVILRLVESGMMLLWDNEIRIQVMKKYHSHDEQQENKIFTLNDLEVAFIVLSLGYCCSICVFVWEICAKKITEQA